MKLSINELNIKKEVLIDEDFVFDIETSLGIKSIDKMHFTGKVYYNSSDEIMLTGNLFGDVILEDSVDLSDYLLKIDVNIEEIIENYENTLDINQVLWENIVLEVPIRATNKKISDISGNGWKVTDGSNEKENIDPRLEVLKKLYEGGEK